MLTIAQHACAMPLCGCVGTRHIPEVVANDVCEGLHCYDDMQGKLCAMKVREAVSILDLDVMFYPCPAGGPTWREKVRQKGGKASFPYMVDPNTGLSLSFHFNPMLHAYMLTSCV